MGASSLVLKGGFCLIVMCQNAPLNCRCSRGSSLVACDFYSLVVLRSFLSVSGRGLYSTCSRGSSLFAVEGALSRVMPWVFSPVVVVGQSPIWAGGFLCHCGHRFLLSFGIGLPSSSGEDLGLLSNCSGEASGGSLWGECSTFGIGGSF